MSAINVGDLPRSLLIVTACTLSMIVLAVGFAHRITIFLATGTLEPISKLL